MIRPLFRRRTSSAARSRSVGMVAALLCLPVLFGVQSIAAGQSPADVRTENARLRSENEELRKELATLRAEIARLQEQLARARPAPQAPSGPREIQRPVIDESRPFASPPSVFHLVRTLYAEHFKDADLGAPDTPERMHHLRRLDEWRRIVHRERVATVEWHMLILEANEVRQGVEFRLQAVDPESGEHLGDPVRATGARSVARTYATMTARGGLEDPVLIRGVVRPILHINPERATPGPFDNPPLAGPFVEMDLTLSVQSLARPRPRPPEREPKPAPSEERR